MCKNALKFSTFDDLNSAVFHCECPAAAAAAPPPPPPNTHTHTHTPPCSSLLHILLLFLPMPLPSLLLQVYCQSNATLCIGLVHCTPN